MRPRKSNNKAIYDCGVMPINVIIPTYPNNNNINNNNNNNDTNSIQIYIMINKIINH